MIIIVLAVLVADRTLCLTREQLLQHLKEKQDTRNTFDSRVPRFIQPIGYVDDEPIWPRVLDTVKSEAELFFDDDNFAYRVHPAALIRKMDKEDNYNKVISFLEKYI
uniref:Secreted protein n=1 Tax=Angiostrongylus cantonensis TaxID=6313 RepID=A0A0K0DES7_ANGCA